MKLRNGERVERIESAARYTVRRQGGDVVESAPGCLPTGYWVGDYFSVDGVYLGPDVDGVEPSWQSACSCGGGWSPFCVIHGSVP